VPLPETNPEKLLTVPSVSGKIINIENIFPEWIDNENWAEPIAPEKTPQIRFPAWLNVDKSVNFTTFYELDVSDQPVDPKAKKKETKKPPAKGKEEIVEMVEVPVNDIGRALPVVYRDDGNEDFKSYPALKTFAQKPVFTDENTQKEVVDDVDPLLCDAFRVISTFVPLIINHSNSQHLLEKNEKLSSLNENYLWRAIYPKLPNGKPCYNPNGKYCVKIFLANKWRKIYVDDTIPLTADGKPAIAFSADKLELWPLLLAKAIYTVYAATGYTFAEELSAALNPEQSKQQPVSSNNNNTKGLSVPLLTSQFVGFVIHILTGWQHHQSIDAANLFYAEKSRTIRLLQYLVDNGVPLINCEDIIGEDDSFKFASDPRVKSDNNPASTEVGAVPEGATDQQQPTDGGGEGNEEDEGENNDEPEIMKKTKRRFKEEYVQRKQIRDAIVEKISIREKKVNNVTKTLQKGSVEVFFVVKYDFYLKRFRVYPVLGISYHENAQPNYENYHQIQFLLNWNKYDPVGTIPNVEDPIILGKGKIPVKEFIEPFPLASPVDYMWHSVDELVTERAFLTALFTNVDTPYSADYSRHWVSNIPETTQAVDPKAKDAKKAGGKDAKNAPTQAVEETFIDPGSFPITFLSVDPSQLYEEMEKELKQSMDALDLNQNNNEPANVEDEVQEALRQQNEEMNRFQSSSSNPNSNVQSATSIQYFDYDKDHSTIKNFSIKLVLTLICDIHSEVTLNPPPPPDVGSPLSPAPGVALNRQGSVFSEDKSVVQNKIHPSDTTVTLQEVRFDDTQPLMFIMSMKETQHLPIVSKSFSIPFERLTSREPIIFWVRVFTKSSVCFHLNSNVPLLIDPAEKLWNDSLHYSSLLREGDTEVTVEESEQLLFRLPIDFQAKPKEEGTKPAEEQSTTLHNNDSDVVLPSPTEISSPKILIFLYVKEFNLEKLLKLLILTSHKQDPSEISILQLSNPLGQIIPLSISDVNELHQLIAYITPTMKTLQIPKFHWKLLVLSKDYQFIEPERPVQETAISQRYLGKYVANNELKLFRDVYSFDKTSFPLAFKFSVSPFVKPAESKEGVSGAETLVIDGEEEVEQIVTRRPGQIQKTTGEEPIAFILRLYRKSDLTCIAEYASTDLLHIYNIDLEPFLPVGEATEAAKPDPKGKAAPAAAAAKGGKNAPAVVVDSVDIIMECVVNEDTLIPSHWKSLFPHVFDEFIPSSAEQTSDGINFYKETLSQQNNFLVLKPPEDPLLSWKLDFLSGKVVSVSHDISTTVKYTDVKKQWEQSDSSGNRLEKAMASATYFKEREDAKNGILLSTTNNQSTASNAPSRPKTPADAVKTVSGRNTPAGKITETQTDLQTTDLLTTATTSNTAGKGMNTRKTMEITPTMIESLSQALAIENDEVKNRFTNLNKAEKVRKTLTGFLHFQLIFVSFLLLDRRESRSRSCDRSKRIFHLPTQSSSSIGIRSLVRIGLHSSSGRKTEIRRLLPETSGEIQGIKSSLS
jgi:hypothetical protein